MRILLGVSAIFVLAMACGTGCGPADKPASSGSNIPPEYDADGKPNTSPERERAVRNQMVKQGADPAEASAFTKSVS